jgi:hypothetical protein
MTQRQPVEGSGSKFMGMQLAFPANDVVMSNVSYYTAEGLRKVKVELNHLRVVERT